MGSALVPSWVEQDAEGGRAPTRGVRVELRPPSRAERAGVAAAASGDFGEIWNHSAEWLVTRPSRGVQNSELSEKGPFGRMVVPIFGDFQLCFDSAEWLVTRPSGSAQKVEISDLDRLGRMEDDSAGLLVLGIWIVGIIRPSDGSLGRAATCGIFGS